MKAICLIREQPWYRRDAFVAGLRAAGHDVTVRPSGPFDRDTLLLIWNRYPPLSDIALQVEKAGGRVIVAENGYIGRGGGTPKFDVFNGEPSKDHYYALAEGWHNGGGHWNSGGPERFDALEVAIKPWRERGDEIVVCPNRSFGVPGRMMPQDWAERAALKIQRQTTRRVRIRRHPGNKAPALPLMDDLKNAHAVVVWSSSSGVHALLDGIPVFCESPYWILKGAAAGGSYDAPAKPDRYDHFRRLAWAQWTIEEIASGVPFRVLLED